MRQQLLFCGSNILPQTTLSMALPYGNNIPVVAIKNCNILVLVVLTSYRNGTNVCGKKLLQQYKHSMAIIYFNKADFGGAKTLSQHVEGLW
jgi:hypothetical protein